MRRQTAAAVALSLILSTLSAASAPQDRGAPLLRPEPPGDGPTRVRSAVTRYFGGSSTDTSHALAVDSQRNIYIAGFTSSPELLSTFPLPQGTTFPLSSGTAFPYLAKFDARGQIVYLHNLPISASAAGPPDSSFRISLAIDAADNVYATGRFNGLSYFTKLDPSGKTIFFRTFAAADIGFGVPTGVAVNARGEAVLAGGDAHVLKVNPQGTVMWSQHLGAGTGSTVNAAAIDASGSIYIVGMTNLASFPTTSGSFQPRMAPGSCPDPGSSSRNITFIPCADAFVAKLTSQGAVAYASFFGGARIDTARAIAVDNTGAATIAGYTESFDLPTVNAARPRCAATGSACGNLFVAKVSPGGSQLVYATYYGGSGATNSPSAVAVDAFGTSYVVGSTNSKDWPIVNAMQPAYGNGPVFASPDRGLSWASSSAGLITNALYSIVWPRSDIVYARGDLGVFRSTDGGATWTALAIGERRLSFIIVDPTNPSIVYGHDGGANLYKSLDSGQQWTRLTLPTDCTAGFVISPAQSAVVYRGGTHVCRSEDAGSTWRTVFTPTASNPWLVPLAADPRNAATAYAVTRDQLYRESIQKTVDGGRTWNPIGSLPRLAPGTATYESAPTRLLIDPEDSQTIYTTVRGGVVRSKDGGATWTSISAGLPASRSGPGFVQTTTNDIAQDPARPQTLYAAGADDALYWSDDRGGSWQRVNAAFPNVQLVAANGGRVLLATTTGSDGFLVALNPDGAVLTSTYIGGTGYDTVADVKAIGLDAIAIAGTTSSPYWPFAGGAEREYHGGTDVFWTQIISRRGFGFPAPPSGP